MTAPRQPRDWAAFARAAVLVATCEGISSSCTSACLLGIAINEIFSILFCVLLGIFAIIFAVIAWKSASDQLMRYYSIAGAILMPLAGIAALFVDNDFLLTNHWAAKCPLFMLLAAGIFVNFTINIIQIINCSSCYHFKDRLLTTRTQVTALLGLNVALGVVLGLVFGLLDPEDEDAHRGNMTTVVIIFLFVGIAGGVGFGCFNEYQTQNAIETSLTKPLTSVDASAYDQM
jgi:hypothetical protein